MTAPLPIDQLLRENPVLLRTVLEFAVDNAWLCIEGVALPATIGEVEWQDLGKDAGDVDDAVQLLAALGLLEKHPARPTLVREVAEL